MDLWSSIRKNKIWRSIFRTPHPIRTRLHRSLVIFNNLALHIHPVKVRERAIRFSYTFYLGMTSFVLGVIIAVTGVLLMLYYQPAIPEAYENMKDLQYVISHGMLMRNMHRWAGHLMVIVVFLHLLRVFYDGAYRPPREFNWVIGVVLFIMTLLEGYTGYLLPYDQLSYWAVTVGANIIEHVPLIGDELRFLFLGGNEIGEVTLMRFYVLHCIILPIIMCGLLGVHFWRIRKDGGLAYKPDTKRKKEPQNLPIPNAEKVDPENEPAPITPSFPEDDTPDRYVPPDRSESGELRASLTVQEASGPIQFRSRLAVFPERVPDRFKNRPPKEKLVTTFPHLLIRELICFQAVLIVVTVISLLFDAPLEIMADPSHTPNPSKAPWYFLGIQELLHNFPPVVSGVIIPLLSLIALFVVPYFNMNNRREPLWSDFKMKRILWITAVSLTLIISSVLYSAYTIAVPTLLITILILLPPCFGRKRGLIEWLASRSLSFWIMTWFVTVVTVLTLVGTFFRGEEWSWVWPWN